MIDNLQSLRLFFAIMIFFHHYIGFYAGGSCGVSFFMILSGFAMSAGYGSKVLSDNFNFKSFLFKRVTRIYPLHLLCLLIFVVLNIANLDLMDYLKLIPNLLLLQSWFPSTSFYFSGNAVSWCLSDLLFFYCLFPYLYRFFDRLRYRNLMYLGFLLIILYIVIMLILPEKLIHPILYISPVFRLYDFILGIFTFKVFKKLSNKKYIEKFSKLSFLEKSFIEIIILSFLLLIILFVPIIETRYICSFIWWFIIPIIIFYFALFNKRGYLGLF